MYLFLLFSRFIPLFFGNKSSCIDILRAITNIGAVIGLLLVSSSKKNGYSLLNSSSTERGTEVIRKIHCCRIRKGILFIFSHTFIDAFLFHAHIQIQPRRIHYEQIKATVETTNEEHKQCRLSEPTSMYEHEHELTVEGENGLERESKH